MVLERRVCQTVDGGLRRVLKDPVRAERVSFADVARIPQII